MSRALDPERLKICLASRAPFLGGAEVAAEDLARGLQQAGHDVFLVLDHAGPVLDRLQRAGLRCLCSPLPLTDKWRPWQTWRARRALKRILRVEKPHVVHSNDLPTHQPVSAVARGLGLPCVCHHRFFYDSAAVDWFNKYGADQHIFVSRALRAKLSAGSATLPAQPGAQIYDGVVTPPPVAAALRAERRQQADLPDKVIVLFAGQIIPIKGVQDLIRAWALLNEPVRARAQLVIIGEDLQGQGRYRREMEELAASCGGGIRFTGFQKNVADWLTAADVAVVPSHQEPLGMATLEAMAKGLPVIGGDVDGIREMIVSEQTGLLVPPANPPALAAALTRLIEDEAARRRLGDSGRERCRTHFSLEQSVQQVSALYRELLERQENR